MRKLRKLLFLFCCVKSDGLENKYYEKNAKDPRLIGYLCTWEDDWCAGWKNVNQTGEEFYEPALVSVYLNNDY